MHFLRLFPAGPDQPVGDPVFFRGVGFLEGHQPTGFLELQPGSALMSSQSRGRGPTDSNGNNDASRVAPGWKTRQCKTNVDLWG